MTYCYAFRHNYDARTVDSKTGLPIGHVYRFAFLAERKHFLSIFDNAEAITRTQARKWEPLAFNENALKCGVCGWEMEGDEGYWTAERAR